MFVYKPCGIEGSEIADLYKKLLNKKKVCLCGKLDIMAEGLLQLLFDEDCKNMKHHLNHNKVYRFKILWGFQTDTSDPLGLITNYQLIDSIDNNFINKNMESFIGTYIQKFHNYSAKTAFNNKGEKHTLWEWSKLNRLHEITIPEKTVDVKYIKLIQTQQTTLSQIKKQIISTLKLIKGNYRQDIILQQWSDLTPDIPVFITEFEAHVSSGFYIRQLIEDFALKTGLIGLAYNINRIAIL